MIKVSVNDYKTEIVTINIDDVDHDIEIRSLLSSEFKKGQAEYFELHQHAIDNKIDMEVEVEVDHGLGIVTKSKERSEFAKKAFAILLSKLVVRYPTDKLLEDILESDDLAELIDSTGTRLKKEFEAKKKL